MSNKDFYKVLDVSENSSEADIKRSYRDLAKKYHPDKHKGDKVAEERFKDISEAYAVLSNPKKRQQYDHLRKYGAFNGGGPNSGNMNFDDLGSMFSGARTRGQSKGGFSFDGFGDIFSQFFSGAGPGQQAGFSQQPTKGRDIGSQIIVPFDIAAKGGKQVVSFVKGGKTQKLSIKIPAGSDDGKIIRLRGQGEAGVRGGQSGDLLLTLQISKHPMFTRKGLDIYSNLNINVFQAILGTKTRIATLDSGTVELKITPGTQQGKLLKLKGLGVKTDAANGDFYAKINIVIPEKLSDSAKKKLVELAKNENIDL